MAYYDPTTYAAVDPTKVTKSISGYDEWNNPQYGYSFNDKPVNEISGTGVNGWGDWLANQGASANARSYNRLQQYMGDLSSKYGLGANDFIKGFQSYGAQYNPEEGFGRDPNMGWWGEDAMIRALGQGLDKANPGAAYNGSWNSLWNQQRELGQQNEIANIWQQNQDRFSKANDFIGTDLPTILGGLGLVAGAGALGGAFGGSGLFGGSGVGAAGQSAADAIIGAGGLEGGGAGVIGNLGGGVGAFPEVAAVGGTGGGSGGGGMDWLDQLIQSTGTDTAGWQNTWANGADQFLDPNAYDLAAQWEANALKDAGINPVKGGVMQQVVDAGVPFDVASKLNPSQLLQLGKGLLGTGAATGTGGGTRSTASMIGTGLGGILDYLGTSKQADNLKAIADRSWAAGQPYRDRANAAMTPGFDIKSIPGLSSAMDTATETYLRKLSATNGNPAGIGAAPSQTEAFVLGNVALPAWQNYFNANSNAGGLSNLSAQANSTATQAAGADAASYGSLGTTANKLLNPQQDQTSQYLKLLSNAYGLA